MRSSCLGGFSTIPKGHPLIKQGHQLANDLSTGIYLLERKDVCLVLWLRQTFNHFLPFFKKVQRTPVSCYLPLPAFFGPMSLAQWRTIWVLTFYLDLQFRSVVSARLLTTASKVKTTHDCHMLDCEEKGNFWLRFPDSRLHSGCWSSDRP